MSFFQFINYITVLIIIVNVLSYSQDKIHIKTSGSNLFRYGNGSEILYSNSVKKEYFENITDAKLSINNFTLGLRLEYINPAETGRNFKGLRKRYIEYNTGNFEIRAGNFGEIFGRGLTLNCFEQREPAFDTGIDGIRITYKRSFTNDNKFRIKSGIIGGHIEYSDYLKPDRIEKYDLRNIHFEGTLFTHLSIGINYVYASGNIPAGNTSTDIEAYLPEVFINVNSPKFQLFSSYAHKRTDVYKNQLYPVNFSSSGDGFYFSGSYTAPGIGITLEYKNYRFDLTAPGNRSNERATKFLPFQNPPTVLKQQTSALTSRISHPVDFNDDVGFQLDVITVPNDRLFFIFNAAVSSRHYSFYDADTSSKIIFTALNRKFDFLPSFDDSYSPNIEISAEAEYDYSDKLYGKIGLFCQRAVNYNYFIKGSSEKILYCTIPAEINYELNDKFSCKLHVEAQVVKNSFGSQNYNNYFASFNINRSPDLSFTLNADFTTDKFEPSGKSNWVEAEISCKLNSSNIVTAAYGSERGGLRCSGGICRFINPFNGFRLTIQSLFE